MKWIFYVVVFIYLCFRAVYGAKVVPNTLRIDKINYGKSTFWKSGTRQSIICKPSNKNQEVEWIDPSGNVVKRVPQNRVFSQEHFVQTQKGRTPALMLTFKSIFPKDSGHYTCQSDGLTDSVDVCVIEPLEFVDTPAEVAADTGRSITLSCQANGDPEPMITWKRNDEIIDDETNSTKYKAMRKYNSQGYEGLLTIISLEPGDSGVYHCEAKQENPLSADCTNSDTVNVTLHVNHAPSFVDGDDTKRVYATNNQSVQLVCSATGYPTPTFKWFRVVDSDTLNGIDDKLIEYNEERTQAVLSVTANTATFGQRYKCQVSNNLGDAEKHFTVLEIDKPQKPSQVNPFKSTDDQIDLKIMWSGPILFPIDGFEIQYMKQEDLKRPGHQPRESDWNKAKLAIVDMDDTSTDEDEELPGIITSITDLDELTVYWVRLRVINDVGESPWCMPVLVTTLKKSEEETEPPTEEPVIENEQGQNKTATAGLTGDPGTFYGIFFAGGIIIVAVVCMFAMRMV